MNDASPAANEIHNLRKHAAPQRRIKRSVVDVSDEVGKFLAFMHMAYSRTSQWR